MQPLPALDEHSETPLYRQLYEAIRSSIADGRLARGERLQPTRELAGQLGLNRTTVAAAYELLEQEGLIRAHVGRGSFVAEAPAPPPASVQDTISFATSRPVEGLFPMDEFRAAVDHVLRAPDAASLLQIGSPQGYAPLRRYLGGDVLVTSGAQQALDLIQRVLAPPASLVAVEDPTYPGLKNVFERAGVELAGFADITKLDRPASLAIVTPNFHNPTGRTLTLAERERLLAAARRHRVRLVEIDIYTPLRYQGEPLPSLRDLDGTGEVLQIGSFSKVAFPGLRTGWIKGPADLIARLTEAKQWSDLHSDQLSQAILLRFAESGQLEQHGRRVVAQGARQLKATLEALEREMPPGTAFSRPEGGMNLWVRLPEGWNAEALAADAAREGVPYLPARFFAAGPVDTRGFRLSFGGLPPAQITEGIARLGRVFRRQSPAPPAELATAMV